MQFFIADVRKRTNADSNVTHQAVPEVRNFPDDAKGGDGAFPQMKNYKKLLATFSEFAPRRPMIPLPSTSRDAKASPWNGPPAHPKARLIFTPRVPTHPESRSAF